MGTRSLQQQDLRTLAKAVPMYHWVHQVYRENVEVVCLSKSTGYLSEIATEKHAAAEAIRSPIFLCELELLALSFRFVLFVAAL